MQTTDTHRRNAIEKDRPENSRRAATWRRSRGGFTLGELLIVVGLLCVVAAIVAIAPRYLRYLPDVNASLNGTATVFLLAGYIQIKRRRERSHKAFMLAAFAISVLFLTTYLVYHFYAGSKPFPGTGAIRAIYLTILISHILLAAVVPLLVLRVIWLGLTDQRAKHRRLARWTFPIWLYVSITGVVVYWMLYHLASPPEAEPVALPHPTALEAPEP